MALHGDEDGQAACCALGASGRRDPARGSSHDGAPPLRFPERAFPIPGAADEPWHALERVPGAGYPEGADDDARVPGDGTQILDEVLGFRPDFIEHQLAHAVRDPNGRAYNRTAFLPERRVMMQSWADYLDRLRAGEIEQGSHGGRGGSSE